MKWPVILILFLFFENAYAQGIGIVPASLKFSGAQGEISERQFIIYNPSEEEMHFSVDGPFLFSEKYGVIEAGGSRKVLASTALPEKNAEAMINVIGTSSEEGIAINVGVAIDAELTVIKAVMAVNPVIGTGISASIVAIGLGIFSAFGGFRKNQE